MNSSAVPVPGDIVVLVASETRREVKGPAAAAGPGGRKRGPNYQDMMQLEKLYLMAAENFTVSRSERLELIQLVGWTVLLVGYFVLLGIELARAG